MKLLAIETTADACSLALSVDEDCFVVHEIAVQQQAQIILPRIKTLFEEHAIKLKDLDAIAFGCGPGSFTGVRIGVSVAQGLGFGLDKPLIPVSSLAALAQAAFMDLGKNELWVATDARMGEIYTGLYRINHRVNQGLVELVGQESVCPLDAVTLPQGDWFGVGNGFSAYSQKINQNLCGIDAARLPEARGIIPLAKHLWNNKTFINPALARPKYLRDNIANRGS